MKAPSSSRFRRIPFLYTLVAVIGTAAGSPAQVPTRSPSWQPDAVKYDLPFFPDASYDASVPTPEQMLGFPLGTRPALHAELQRCLEAWRGSKRLTVHEYARSHEQRPLYYAVITSEKNHARLDAIRDSIGKLADPRRLTNDAEAQRLIQTTPAIAWMAYSIHGDELSSTDAAIALMHHLLAGTSDEVLGLLDELVVIVDPLMNPDGRNRILRQLDQYRGYTPNFDTAALQHSGRWPRGRGNHYYFDLNRDWILGVHPETRGRQRAVAEWHPQLFIDSHEMGSHDTYLFNPPREPFNPHLPGNIRKWWTVFAADQSQAFDRRGWSYYTREWLEFWYPGYSDSWACFHGAIGILYEQASTGGHPIRQRSGSILTYREAVHHQATSSLANLKTLRAHRSAILADYWKHKREALEPADDAPGRVFLLPPAENKSRVRAFLDNLHNQGIEIGVAREAFVVKELTNTLRQRLDRREFPAGTYVISGRQPAGPLVNVILGFDPRMDDAFLASERKELETKRQSRIYDVTGWSLPMAYALEAYWSDQSVGVASDPYAPRETPAPSALPLAEPSYAYVIDGADDASVEALAHLLQNNVKTRVAEKEFRSAGRTFPRGSLLIRRHENDEDLGRKLNEMFLATGAPLHAARTARSPDDAPDLGGRHFILLHRPRVAMIGDGSVSTTSYGALWRLLDEEIGVAVSLLDANSAASVDLRPYNVLILPSTFGKAGRVYEPLLDRIKPWVRAGGTLIAVGNAAAFLADEKLELSAVRRRRDVLTELDAYDYALALERAAGKKTLDIKTLWQEPTEAPAPELPKNPPDTDTAAETLDEWRRVFSPAGVVLRGELNRDHWLTFGCPDPMPLYAAGSYALLSRHPVQTPVRLAPSKILRLSGLLWPEAATRMGGSAYVTRESVGNGQLILFAHEPDFRGAWHGTRRLFLNAVLLGAGCGTSQAVPNP